MVFFMYHELELAGRKFCEDEPGYVRYIVRAGDFRSQMEYLKQKSWRAVNVSEALSFAPTSVAVTFDDGCETDLLLAAPILMELGFGATFYITSGFLGRQGYLNETQLRELHSRGFEIGSHAATHAYLPDLNEKDLRREIFDSKSQLEQITGEAVAHFSCPGGRFNQRTKELVRDAGYRTMATSRTCVNLQNAERYALGRVAVMRQTTMREFDSYCQGDLKSRQLRESIQQTAQSMLGNAVYDRIRKATLRITG